jgi:hypothetical protein
MFIWNASLPNLSTRLAIGFAAGALSHVVFQGALGTAYHAAGLIPGLPWSLDPVAPLGVPRSASLAFWAGLWGVLFGALQPQLGPRLGVLGSSLALAIAALIVRWLVVLPLKGDAIAEGFVPQAMLVFIGFHLAFGIGVALLYAGICSAFDKPAATTAAEHNIHRTRG